MYLQKVEISKRISVYRLLIKHGNPPPPPEGFSSEKFSNVFKTQMLDIRLRW